MEQGKRNCVHQKKQPMHVSNINAVGMAHNTDGCFCFGHYCGCLVSILHSGIKNNMLTRGQALGNKPTKNIRINVMRFRTFCMIAKYERAVKEARYGFNKRNH